MENTNAVFALVVLLALAAPARGGELRFRHQFIERDLPGTSYGQTSLVDIDGDGKLDVLTLSDRNNLRWYRIAPDPRQPWQRTDIGPGVHAGIGVGDIDGDGDLDVARSNAWYENAGGKGDKWTEHANTPFGKKEGPFPLSTLRGHRHRGWRPRGGRRGCRRRR